MDVESLIVRRVSAILNLPLTIARDAGNMKNFQFGEIRPHPSGKGTVGSFALHIQCPWRILSDDRVVTGSTDYYEPAVGAEEPNLEDHSCGNLQRERLLGLLGSYDPVTKSIISNGERLLVTAVHGDRYGGLDIELLSGLRLQVLPSGAGREDWRFFAPGRDDHFIVEGGFLSGNWSTTWNCIQSKPGTPFFTCRCISRIVSVPCPRPSFSIS
jgi:hypothetical protein